AKTTPLANGQHDSTNKKRSNAHETTIYKPLPCRADTGYRTIDHRNSTATNPNRFPRSGSNIDPRYQENGDIVGRYVKTDGTTHGFLLRAGVFTTIDVPGAIQTNVAGINSHGDIVGRHVTPDMVSHVFVLSGGVFTTIDFPVATFTGGARSNNRGQIAGVYTLADGVRHGFLFDDGKFAAINYPGALGTQLFDINEQGTMVGHYLTP